MVTGGASQDKVRVLLIALYSENQPSIGESLALPVLGGCLESSFGEKIEVNLLDLYSTSGPRDSAVIEAVNTIQPHIIGISVVYGSYYFLEDIYPKLLQVWKTLPHLTIFGGPTPTYAPEQFVPSLDAEAVVVIGEGDTAIVQLVNSYLADTPYYDVPNTFSMKEGQTFSALRQLVDLSVQPLPKRSNSATAAENGGQIFIEASRGCSWAACTFCKRGLTDIKGRSNEYRRFSAEHVVGDLEQLYKQGVRNVTFTDEEFLGHLDNSALNWLMALREGLHLRGVHMKFDISVMPSSVIISNWQETDAAERRKIWDILLEMGLRKAFLGIESGSASQLKRYAKHATSEQNAEAIDIIRSRKIALECGFIMFDPLCTVEEIRENIRFIAENSIIENISAINNELRIDKGSKYDHLLQVAERKHNTQLFDRSFDKSTLAYKPLYLHKEIEIIVKEVREWRSDYGRLHYLLKSLSRYGTQGAVGEHIEFVRQNLAKLRHLFFENFSNLVDVVAKSTAISKDARAKFYSALSEHSSDISHLLLNVNKEPDQNTSNLNDLISTAQKVNLISVKKINEMR